MICLNLDPNKMPMLHTVLKLLEICRFPDHQFPWMLSLFVEETLSLVYSFPPRDPSDCASLVPFDRLSALCLLHFLGTSVPASLHRILSSVSLFTDTAQYKVLSLHCVAQCPGVFFVADKNFWEGSCRRSEQTDGGRGGAGGEDGWTSWGGRGAPRQRWENKTEERQSSLTRSLFGFRCGCQRLGLMGFSPSRLLFGPPPSRGGPVSGGEGVGRGPRADCPVLLVLWRDAAR